MLNIQVSLSDLGQDEMYDVFGEVASNGLSGESLKKLPCHAVTDEKRDGSGESICCAICLQVLFSFSDLKPFFIWFLLFLFHCVFLFYISGLNWFIQVGICFHKSEFFLLH